MAKKVDTHYDSSEIQVLEGLEPVRKRPGMYIGSTDERGLHHLIVEIVDNSVDEALAGYCDTIIIELTPEGAVAVTDNGRGIPVDIHPKEKISSVEVVLTKLHAGGKFGGGGYKVSGGLHGVGLSVVNALSEWLEVEVYKNGKMYRQKYNRGVHMRPLAEVGRTERTGTKVTFFPDDEIFETIEFTYDVIRTRMREVAYLNRGLTIQLIDNRPGREKQETFRYDGGILDFVDYLNRSKETLFPQALYIEKTFKDNTVEIAMQYNDSYSELIYAYANNINTEEGGTHLVGFKNALTKVINDYAHEQKVIKEEEKLTGDDVREGLTAIVSVKLTNPQFEGQTKTKLGNPEARIAIEYLVNQTLSEFFEKDTKGLADIILKKAVLAAKVREAARKEKEITRAKNSLDNNFNLVGKLSSCTGKKPENNELFIVEGDSAGGTAKQARNRSFQAILPLRGKPLNAEKKRIDQVLANEEIRTIISALGSGIGEDFNVDNLNYHKVIILSDADQDGAHIRAILLTFFFRYMKDLINEGHVYIGLPPLYRISKKDTVEYVYDDVALEDAKKRFGKGAGLQRYKGLGEMSAEQLWETTMDPNRRTLVQVTIEDAATAEMLVSTLMGDAIDLRRRYIIQNANFNKEDNFKVQEAK